MNLIQRLRRVLWFTQERRSARILRDEQATLRRWAQRAAEER